MPRDYNRVLNRQVALHFLYCYDKSILYCFVLLVISYFYIVCLYCFVSHFVLTCLADLIWIGYFVSCVVFLFLVVCLFWGFVFCLFCVSKFSFNLFLAVLIFNDLLLFLSGLGFLVLFWVVFDYWLYFSWFFCMFCCTFCFILCCFVVFIGYYFMGFCFVFWQKTTPPPFI